MIDDLDIERIARRVVELQREERFVKPIAVGVKTAAKMLDCSSESAFYRQAKKLGIKPYSVGKYQAKDIESAVIRLAHGLSPRRPSGADLKMLSAG